jgi:hypothetical protein
MCAFGKVVVASLLEADCICIVAFNLLWGGWDIYGATTRQSTRLVQSTFIQRSTEDDLRMITGERKGRKGWWMLWGSGVE